MLKTKNSDISSRVNQIKKTNFDIFIKNLNFKSKHEYQCFPIVFRFYMSCIYIIISNIHCWKCHQPRKGTGKQKRPLIKEVEKPKMNHQIHLHRHPRKDST